MQTIRALAAAIAVAFTLVSCTSAGARPSATHRSSANHRSSADQGSRTPPLRSETNSQFTYALDDLRSCRVADALSVAVDQAKEPLRVTGAAIVTTGSGKAQPSYKVAAVRPGFTGEIAASSRLAVLAGQHLRSASGAVLSPVSAGQDYVFVVWLRVLGAHPRPWAITGLTVRYQLHRHTYTEFFPQRVRLPAVSCP